MSDNPLYPPSVLAVLFAYQPPNDDTTPRYAAVGAAYDAFTTQLQATMMELELQERDGLTPDFIVLHRVISESALAYATVVNEVCPADYYTLLAVDSVTFARMWANKAIRAADGHARGRLLALARTEGEKAQLVANAGIALYEPMRAAHERLLPTPSAE